MHSYASMEQERNDRRGDKRGDEAPDRPRQSGDEIDENLKRVYSRLLEEGVPDRFQKLLEELRRKDPGK